MRKEDSSAIRGNGRVKKGTNPPLALPLTGDQLYIPTQTGCVRREALQWSPSGFKLFLVLGFGYNASTVQAGRRRPRFSVAAALRFSQETF